MRDGQGGDEGAAGRVGALEVECAVVDFGDPAGDGEAEAGTAARAVRVGARARLVHAIEALEDLRARLRGYAGACVGDRDGVARGHAFETRRDRAARRRVLDGVV